MSYMPLPPQNLCIVSTSNRINFLKILLSGITQTINIPGTGQAFKFHLKWFSLIEATQQQKDDSKF